MTGWSRAITLCIFGISLVGCGTVESRANAGLQLPVPPPGVKYTGTLRIRGAHSLPFHNGEAELNAEIRADGGPALPHDEQAAAAAAATMRTVEVTPGEPLRVEAAE